MTKYLALKGVCIVMPIFDRCCISTDPFTCNLMNEEGNHYCSGMRCLIGAGGGELIGSQWSREEQITIHSCLSVVH